MERRDVLKLGAVAASLGGSGCAALLSNPGAVTGAELPDFLTALDDSMGRIASGSFFQQLMPERPSAALEERARSAEEVAKKTFRSLLLVGTLRELPPEQLAHEAVQARLSEHMDEFDDAMFGMGTLLEGLSASERADISKALRDEPGLGMKVMGHVDEQAAAFGVSVQQRTKLRAVSSLACSRLRQSPDLTLTEYTAKLRKLEARHGARAESERQLAASVGTSLLWQQAEQGSVGGEGEGASLTPPPPPPAEDGRGVSPTEDPLVHPAVPAAPKRRGMRASHVVLTAGGVALGLGLTIFGVGFALGSSTSGAGVALGATFGALFGIIGLVTLIVGLIILAVGK